MNQCIYLGAGVLAFLAMWRYCVRPAALDTARDALFELRSEVREFFLVHEGLESGVYAGLRELINNQIRYLDRAGLVRLAVLGGLGRRSPVASQFADPLHSDDENVQDFVNHARNRAFLIIAMYLVLSRIPGFFFFIGFVGWKCLCTAAARIFRTARAVAHSGILAFRSLDPVPGLMQWTAVVACLANASGAVVTRFVSQGELEDAAQRNAVQRTDDKAASAAHRQQHELARC